jgi:hypothetical protein
MQFEYPSQRFQDWLSQRWVMWRGRQIDPDEHPWLMGPFGNVDVIGDRYVQRLADEEGLTVERCTSNAGLLDSIDQLDLTGDERARLLPEIASFYTRTADHDLQAWSQWNWFFRPFGGLLQILYSRRLQQLNLPLKPLDTARGIRSEFLKLRKHDGDRAVYTVWYRTLKSTGRVIYSGIYATCTTPSGHRCIKVVFPLPRGNATVLLRIEVDERGNLELISEGERFGSPGFYFLLVDSRGRFWAQHIRSFRERIRVYRDEERDLRTDHVLTLWRRKVFELHYRIIPKQRAAS